jgi:hypothetical protein
MGASIIYVCKCECISVASAAAVVVEDFVLGHVASYRVARPFQFQQPILITKFTPLSPSLSLRHHRSIPPPPPRCCTLHLLLTRAAELSTLCSDMSSESSSSSMKSFLKVTMSTCKSFHANMLSQKIFQEASATQCPRNVGRQGYWQTPFYSRRRWFHRQA